MKLRTALISIAMAVLAGQAQSVEPDTVTLNFVNADIEGVVKAVSEITGKNFVLDPRVKGAVNIVSARPMARTLVYEVFLSALRLQGYAAVEERGVVKIIPEADAKLHQGRIVGPNERLRVAGDRTAGDQIVTQVFTLKYESAAQLLPILRPLIAPANAITVYAASNTLVITDYAGNLQRIGRIIDSIDQPGGTDPVVIPLAHASALDVANMVNRLFADPAQAAAGAADTSQRLSVVADTRSNSLVVRSDNPSRITRLRSLVATLDSPTSAAGNLHVVYLKNAEAVKVAETLRAIYLGETAPAAALRPMTLPVTASPAGAPPLALPALSGPQAVALSPGMIQADPATNSILINAPDAIYNNLRAVIDKLDARRAQVYVEALIAEITADKAAEFGIQWQNLAGAGKTDGGARGFGGTNFGTPGQNIIGVAANPAGVARGLNIGVIKGRVTIPGVGEILNLGLLVRALEIDNNANILSTPTLLTLDNEEARIIIGQNVPFITGQYALSGAATTPTPFQTVERRDVGLTLRVKPQISEGGTVRLQIYQEVSSVAPAAVSTQDIITNKRSLQTEVIVNNGNIVALGGLIQDSVTDTVNAVPILGHIPIIGELFKYRARKKEKINLMIFLRPIIISSPEDLTRITADRYDLMRTNEKSTKMQNSLFIPKYEQPVLPEWKNNPPSPVKVVPTEPIKP